MAFTLPPLPYAYDALEPYMSQKTLEFHHINTTQPMLPHSTRLSMRLNLLTNH